MCIFRTRYIKLSILNLILIARCAGAYGAKLKLERQVAIAFLRRAPYIEFLNNKVYVL